jgi:hypothetical protein
MRERIKLNVKSEKSKKKPGNEINAALVSINFEIID